ncbi:MAG: hypothetical protein E7170_04795 [Firmicutes bacterium]|nr:hypothetical protein [Bacillota bacterium]
MNLFEKILYLLQKEMTEPEAFGWFHILWIIITIVSIIFLYKIRNRYNEKQLKLVLGTYGFIALVLEILKQIIWSFNYENGVVIWDYQWYAFPFQLCTTPIFVSIICVFLKKNKIRDALLSYLAFTTILGGLMTILIPDSCLVETILVNIHTMWLHCGSFVISIYLIFNEVKLNIKSLISSFITFIIFVFIAQILNIIIYNIGILNDEVFNMFYISPYFISELPIFNTIQQNVPFILYLLIYIVVICLGSTMIYLVSKTIKNIIYKILKI